MYWGGLKPPFPWSRSRENGVTVTGEGGGPARLPFSRWIRSTYGKDQLLDTVASHIQNDDIAHNTNSNTKCHRPKFLSRWIQIWIRMTLYAYSVHIDTND